MGSHTFSERGYGRNVTEAYRDACNQAEYEDGHDGYNGTISTTRGVREIPARKLKGLAMKTRIAILDALVCEETPKGLSPKARAVLAQLQGSYRAEKWGACLAIQIRKKKDACIPHGHKVYIFAGWAAS